MQARHHWLPHDRERGGEVPSAAAAASPCPPAPPVFRASIAPASGSRLPVDLPLHPRGAANHPPPPPPEHLLLVASSLRAKPRIPGDQLRCRPCCRRYSGGRWMTTDAAAGRSETARADLSQCSAHLIRAIEDVFGKRADGRVALARCGDIATAIFLLLLPSLVMSLTVALDDQPAVDDEVDATDAPHFHLQLVCRADLAQHETHERFCARLAAGIDHGLPPREAREDLADFRHRGQPHVQHAIDGGDREGRRLAPHGTAEGIEDRDGVTVRRNVPQVHPVQGDLSMRRGRTHPPRASVVGRA